MGRVYVRKFDWDEAARLRAEGLSYEAIGARLGVSLQAVRRVLLPEVRALMNARSAAWMRENSRGRGTCSDCGGTIDLATERYRGGRCRRCNMARFATSVRPDALRCCGCHEWKPDSEFGRQTSAIARRGRNAECKPCAAARRRAARHANPDLRRRENDARMRRHYASRQTAA